MSKLLDTARGTSQDMYELIAMLVEDEDDSNTLMEAYSVVEDHLFDCFFLLNRAVTILDDYVEHSHTFAAMEWKELRKDIIERGCLYEVDTTVLVAGGEDGSET